MSTKTTVEQEQQSFAETALRLGGKSDEEVQRTGAMDRADEQVEKLFAQRHQTSHSPVHRAVWEREIPIDLFLPPALPASEPCDAAMNRSLEVVKKRVAEKSLLDDNGKLRADYLQELAAAGYWGMLIDPKYGGQGASFLRFARFLTRVAMYDPMTAGLASVHGCIGAVDPVRSFGTPAQKSRFLPRLASGEALSGFALTEPCAGSDLTALRTVAVPKGDYFEISGEKLFITNAIPGRTIGLVVMLEGKPAVIVTELPPEQNEQFQMVRYGLYALRQGHNNGLRFNGLRVPRENLLVPPTGDGLTIAYHGLNLGRLALCANAAGTMRVMLANILPWASFRRTYGQPINTRELVKRRIARLAGLIAGTDALVDWGSWLIDQGFRGELECIIAKIFGSEAQKEASIELFMKTHGGRSFLHGHMFGDNVHEYLAPCIYEGECEMLGLAFFKSLVKEHGRAFFEPIGKALQKENIRAFSPANPIHVWKLRKEIGSYLRWSAQQKMAGKSHGPLPRMDARLQKHVSFAVGMFKRFPAELSAAMSKHQLKLADRQCRMAELSQRVQDGVVMLVTALWGSKQSSESCIAAADFLCQDLQRKITGKRPSDQYFRDSGKLADMIISGGYEALVGAPVADIMMKYETK